MSHVSQKTNFETTTKHTTMSTANRSKPLETAAIIIGVLAIAASAYFIFMTEGSAYRLTNWIISLAFLVFVAYNFINVRSLKGEVGALSDRNAEVTQELQGTKTIPAKKMNGKKKPDDLTHQQRAQLEQPLKKVASPATKEAQKPRDSTDADLEKLKAFFGKK